MTQHPLRDAATVMLLRDGAGGNGPLEVFMLRRSPKTDFVAGAYVFPGGAVDEADRHANLERICTGRSDAQASALLGVEGGGLAYWVAAVRECFEEAGVLLAHGPDGRLVSFADPDVARRFEAHRDEVNQGGLSLVELCERESLQLAADRIRYFSHWVTPEGNHRRYDTRFFAAIAPPEQVPLHDNHETVAHVWIRPADALERFRKGEMEMIRPTWLSLEAIGRFDRADDVMAALAVAETAPALVPRLPADERGVRILLPGDAGYDDALKAEVPR